jgi:hypothetical protein
VWADLLYGCVDPVRQSLLLEAVHSGFRPRPSLLLLFKQLMRRLLQQLMPTLPAFELPFGGAADSGSLEYRGGGSFRRSAVSHDGGGLTSEKGMQTLKTVLIDVFIQVLCVFLKQ